SLRLRTLASGDLTLAGVHDRLVALAVRCEIEIPAGHLPGNLERFIVEDEILLNGRPDGRQVHLESLHALACLSWLPPMKFDEAALNHEPEIVPGPERSLQ